MTPKQPAPGCTRSALLLILLLLAFLVAPVRTNGRLLGSRSGGASGVRCGPVVAQKGFAPAGGGGGGD